MTNEKFMRMNLVRTGILLIITIMIIIICAGWVNSQNAVADNTNKILQNNINRLSVLKSDIKLDTDTSNIPVALDENKIKTHENMINAMLEKMYNAKDKDAYNNDRQELVKLAKNSKDDPIVTKIFPLADANIKPTGQFDKNNIKHVIKSIIGGQYEYASTYKIGDKNIVVFTTIDSKNNITQVSAME